MYKNYLDLKGTGYFGGNVVDVGDYTPSRWYFSGNGVDQYIRTPDITLSIGDTVEFYFLSPLSYIPSRNFKFIDGVGDVGRLDLNVVVDASGNAVINDRTYMSLTIDGVSTLSLPSDGMIHKIELQLSESRSIGFLSSRYTVSSFSYVSIFDLKVNDGSVYNFPLDDSFANNPVARNTGSGANAAYINATAASWSFE